VHLLSDFIHKLRDLPALIQWAGYIGMFAIIFAETGLLIGIFLPGDSLLVTAGLLSSQGFLDVWVLCPVLTLAAIAGNQSGYFIGRATGPRIFTRENSRFFNRKHVVRAHDFYDKHGGKTLILARFVPIVRTFVPVIAGVGGMSHRAFTVYDISGGFLWIWSMLLTGYFLGRWVPGVADHIEIVVISVIFVSILPGIIGWYRETRKPEMRRAK
jgi:membrane-associated protein